MFAWNFLRYGIIKTPRYSRLMLCEQCIFLGYSVNLCKACVFTYLSPCSYNNWMCYLMFSDILVFHPFSTLLSPQKIGIKTIMIISYIILLFTSSRIKNNKTQNLKSVKRLTEGRRSWAMIIYHMAWVQAPRLCFEVDNWWPLEV